MQFLQKPSEGRNDVWARETCGQWRAWVLIHAIHPGGERAKECGCSTRHLSLCPIGPPLSVPTLTSNRRALSRRRCRLPPLLRTVARPGNPQRWRLDATNTRARALAPICMRASSRCVGRSPGCSGRKALSTCARHTDTTTGARADGGRRRHWLRASQEPRPHRLRRDPHCRPRHD